MVVCACFGLVCLHAGPPQMPVRITPEFCFSHWSTQVGGIESSGLDGPHAPSLADMLLSFLGGAITNHLPACLPACLPCPAAVPQRLWRPRGPSPRAGRLPHRCRLFPQLHSRCHLLCGHLPNRLTQAQQVQAGSHLGLSLRFAFQFCGSQRCALARQQNQRVFTHAVSFCPMHMHTGRLRWRGRRLLCSWQPPS